MEIYNSQKAILGLVVSTLGLIVMIVVMYILDLRLAAYTLGVMNYIMIETQLITDDIDSKSISWKYHLGLAFINCIVFGALQMIFPQIIERWCSNE